MDNPVNYEYDVLIVGGGPAGMAAAAAAAQQRQRVAIVDENSALGGQIWRAYSRNHKGRDFISRSARVWHDKVAERQITVLPGLRVFDAPHPGVLHAESADGLFELRYNKLIVATGARERFLPFPGWTLRNVTGAGGLQAMVKSGLPIAGKRVVVAGSGPLLLAVAAYLLSHGAQVLAVCEQAPLSRLARFSVQLVSDPQKLSQGLAYRLQLRRVPYLTGWWPVAVYGTGKLTHVSISDGVHSREIACDYLACGFHLVPNLELPAMLGCKLENGFVAVDDQQQTSVSNIYCAGELTGIGGLDKSLLEGEIAGLAATGQIQQCQPLFRKRRSALRFAVTLETTFALRPELKNVARSDTLVCRCEDVAFGRLREFNSWHAAKLHTRCGMGPCQGRVCGAATEFLFGWTADSVRPPILPVRFETIAAANE